MNSKTYAAGVILNDECDECGGNEGWVLTDSNPALREQNGKPVQPSDTYRPCSSCRPSQHLRWTRGHFPHCPAPRGKRRLCEDCVRAHGGREVTDDEHLPRQEEPVRERYEAEPVQGEFDVAGG